MFKGIDVSQYQRKINWSKVKADGIDFAIIRIGVGSDIKTQDDKQWLNNCRGAESVGIPYGLYLYSYALCLDDVVSEANHMIRCASQVNPTLGCYFDMEDADGYKKNHGINVYAAKDVLTGFCLKWMELVKNAGFIVGTYANYDYFRNILDYQKIKNAGSIWYAHWGIDKPVLDCDFWQYSDSGRVSGISGNVDMNYMYNKIVDNKPANAIQDSNSYYPKYTGSKTATLIAALNTLGIDSSFNHRAKIALANDIVSNISDFKGFAHQNLAIYDLLKKGQLKKE